MSSKFKNVENSVIPYDQNEIETVMREMLFNKGVTDILYEGSNISQLTSVISYVISSLNVNTAINLQETLLPLATKRMNVLMGARQIGYEPTKKVSYVYNLTLNPTYDDSYLLPDGKIDINNDIPRIVPLVHNTEFKCGSHSYWYVGPTINDFWIVSNKDITDAIDSDVDDIRNKVYKTVQVKEGKIVTPDDDQLLSIHAEDYQDQDGYFHTKQDYIIPYENVEENGINVFLTYVDEYGNFREAEPRYKSDQHLIDENLSVNKDRFVVLDNIILNFPTIFFQIGGFGHPIRTGTLIEVEVLISSGADGEAKGNFRVSNTSVNFEVFEYELVSVGKNEETNESIKENAVTYNNTANRAVTKYDFTAITKRHPLVKDAIAWGGEEEIPKEKGHIWICGIPTDQIRLIKYTKRPDLSQNYMVLCDIHNDGMDGPTLENWYLTENTYKPDGDVDVQGEQEILVEYLDNYKMMTMEAHYRHPLYVNFDLECDIVKYDVTKSFEEVNHSVFEEINNFFIQNIEKFESEYINSNLQRVIDKCLGYRSGITYSIKTTGSLCRFMLDKFNTQLDTLETHECPIRPNRNVIKFTLMFPFENIFSSNGSTVRLDTDLVPKIDTDDFGPYNEKLWVDYDALNSDLPNQNPNYKETKIYLGDKEFGQYVVRRDIGQIEITFEFMPDNPDMNNPFLVPLDYIFIDDNYIEFNIIYPYSIDTSTNIPFGKNVIPRLRNVTFIYN